MNKTRPLIAKLKIGQKQLGMGDEQYRTMLSDRYGKTSSTKLTFEQLHDCVAHMSRLGATFTSSRKRSGTQRDAFYEIPDGTRFAEQKRLIAAMWNALNWKMSGLDVRCRKQFQVDKFLWLNDQRHLQTLAQDLCTRCKKRGLKIYDLPE